MTSLRENSTGNLTQTLIVARMGDGFTDQVRDIFADSDRGPLPHMLNVTQRSLFKYQGLYFHLIEADGDLEVNLDALRADPDYVDINSRLAEMVLPFNPATWSGPSDAMAERFYHWTAQ